MFKNKAAQLEAMARLLEKSGEITPMATRQLLALTNQWRKEDFEALHTLEEELGEDT